MKSTAKELIEKMLMLEAQNGTIIGIEVSREAVEKKDFSFLKEWSDAFVETFDTHNGKISAIIAYDGYNEDNIFKFH